MSSPSSSPSPSSSQPCPWHPHSFPCTFPFWGHRCTRTWSEIRDIEYRYTRGAWVAVCAVLLAYLVWHVGFILLDVGLLDACLPFSVTLKSPYRRRRKSLLYGDLLVLLACFTSACMLSRAVDLHAWSAIVPFRVYVVIGDLTTVAALLITLLIVERCLTAAYVISHPMAQMTLVTRPLRAGMRQFSCLVFIALLTLSVLSVTLSVPGDGYLNGRVAAAKELIVAVFLLLVGSLGCWKTWQAVTDLAVSGKYSLLDSDEAVLVVNSQLCVAIVGSAAIGYLSWQASTQEYRTIRLAPPCRSGDVSRTEALWFFHITTVLGVLAGWRHTRILRSDYSTSASQYPQRRRTLPQYRPRGPSWVTILARSLVCGKEEGKEFGEGDIHLHKHTRHRRASSFTATRSSVGSRQSRNSSITTSRISFGSMRLSVDGLNINVSSDIGPTNQYPPTDESSFDNGRNGRTHVITELERDRMELALHVPVDVAIGKQEEKASLGEAKEKSGQDGELHIDPVRIHSDVCSKEPEL